MGPAQGFRDLLAGELFAVPLRRVVPVRPVLDLRSQRPLRPVEVLRPEDLLHLTFSFVNLRMEAGKRGSPPLLRRRVANRPAFLVAGFDSQHVVEKAFFETADGYPVKDPPKPADVPASQAPTDPHKGKASEALFGPPVFASLSGPTRLVFRVTSQVIPFTAEDLIAAVSYLDLVVAPHAAPPAAPKRPLRIADVLVSSEVALWNLFLAASSRAAGAARRRRKLRIPDEPTRLSADLAGQESRNR